MKKLIALLALVTIVFAASPTGPGTFLLKRTATGQPVDLTYFDSVWNLGTGLRRSGDTIYLNYSGVVPGTYGDATHVPQITVDSFGRATNITSVTISGGGGGGGTVTSVGLSLPTSVFTVSGSPVAGSGTLAGSFTSQSANTAFMAPNGSAGTPTFRAFLPGDISFLTDSITAARAFTMLRIHDSLVTERTFDTTVARATAKDTAIKLRTQIHDTADTLRKYARDRIHDTSLILRQRIADTSAALRAKLASDLTNYLPLSAGSSKALTGDLYTSSNYGIWFGNTLGSHYWVNVASTGGAVHGTGSKLVVGSSDGAWVEAAGFQTPTGTSAQMLRADGTVGTIPASLPPSGFAGGDLGGTYPNPTVQGIKGVAWPALGDGVPRYNGGVTSWDNSVWSTSAGPNKIWATYNGTPAGNAFRSLTVSDIPALNYLPLSGGVVSGYSTFSGGLASTAGIVVTGTASIGSLNGVVRAAAGVLSASALTYADLTGAVPTWNQSTTGSAAKWTTPRTLAATGDIAWSVSVDGSADVRSSATVSGITVTEHAINNVEYPVVWDNQARGLFHTAAKMLFNPSTGRLSATSFNGPLTGNASTATLAVNSSALGGVNSDYFVQGNGTGALGHRTTNLGSVATIPATQSGFADVTAGDGPQGSVLSHLIRNMHQGGATWNNWSLDISAPFAGVSGGTEAYYVRLVSNGSTPGWRQLWHSGSTTITAGAAKIGTWANAANYARFGHPSFDLATGYGYIQNPSGGLYMDAPTGQPVSLGVNGAPVVYATGSGATLAGTTTLSALTGDTPRLATINAAGQVGATTWANDGPWLPLTGNKTITGYIIMSGADLYLNAGTKIRTPGWYSQDFGLSSTAGTFTFSGENFTFSGSVNARSVAVGASKQVASVLYSASNVLPILGLNEWCWVLHDANPGGPNYWVVPAGYVTQYYAGGTTITSVTAGNNVPVAANKKAWTLYGPTYSGSTVMTLRM